METLVKKTRTRLSPEKRKQQLLDYAITVFARRGIGRAGHADIADMAEVSVATVFNYFPTREDLVDQVLSEVATNFEAISRECLNDEETSLRQSVENLMYRLIDSVLEGREWVKVWFEWSTSVREEIWPKFTASNRKMLEAMTKAYHASNGGDQVDEGKVQDTARLLQGICYVLYLQANESKDGDALYAQANHYLDLLCPAQG
uniref:TetR/AcrR family transcriptional regulator n=1 Tax=Thaumasiovibrio occultus TaxID=1891184 RepID=UPI000B35C429|nr:TetR/AcrR family transcriptional regulator [Thaumasiovibrio occultus]